MQLEITGEVMVGSAVSFHADQELWVVRDLHISRKFRDGPFDDTLVSVIAARQKVPESEIQVRIVSFYKSDLSGVIDKENNLFLYLNREKTVTMHLRVVDELSNRRF